MKTIFRFCRWVFLCALLLMATNTHVFAQYTTPDTARVADKTYGPGSIKETRTNTSWDNSKITEVDIKDAKKVIRESHRTEINPDGSKVEIVWIYDANGDKTYYKQQRFDPAGSEILYMEEQTKDRKTFYGYKWSLDKNQVKHTLVFDAKDQVYKEQVLNGDTSSPQTPPADNTASFMPNQLFAGFSMIHEDSKPGFFTYGGEVEFSHEFLTFGIAADLGYSLGSSNTVDYTKKSALVGGVVDILNNIAKKQTEGARLALTAHLLGGVSSITSSFDVAGGTQKFTSNYFTLDLGLGAGLPLNADGSVMLGGNLDYLPTISSGVKNNVRLSVGLKFGFGKKSAGHTKTPKEPKRISIG